MKRVVAEHTAGFVLVTLIGLLLLSLIHSYRDASQTETIRIIAPYLSLDSIDLTDPLQRALFKETLQAFHSDNPHRIDSITAALDSYSVRLLAHPGWNSGRETGLTETRIPRLVWMYFQFVLIVVVVSILTYGGARTAAIYKYIKEKDGTDSPVKGMINVLSTWKSGNPPSGAVRMFFGFLGRGCLRIIASFVFFSPAYVLAYAFKTEIDTSGVLFMIVLAVVSNGVLINLSGSIHTFLTHESRKGYVETAKVKGLDSVYRLPSRPAQITAALFRPLHVYSRQDRKSVV